MLCGGVFISTPHEIQANEDMFVRLIISVNCLMNEHDFGMNPWVRLPPNFSFEPPTMALAALETLAANEPVDAPSRFPTMQFRSHQWEFRELLFQSAEALG
jgi:hypothetical protein